MIKRIPIKGISRDPSGQIAADGFTADSFNVQLDMGELAPAIEPQEAASRFEKVTGGSVNYNDRVKGTLLYIHKGEGYENLITIGSWMQGATYVNSVISYSQQSGGQKLFAVTDYGTEVKDVMAVGNTLIFSTDQHLVYVLYKDGSYRVSGTKIPVPNLSFRIGDLEKWDRSAGFEEETYEDTVLGNITIPSESPNIPRSDATQLELITFLAWWILHSENGASAHRIWPDPGSVRADKWGTRSVQYKTRNEAQQEMLDCANGVIDEVLHESENLGKCHFPFIVRYAVRLYDGSLYAASIPIVLGAELQSFFEVTALTDSDYSDTEGKDLVCVEYRVAASVCKAFSAFVKFNDLATLYRDWTDIVTGIDIFITPQLSPDRLKAKATLIDSYGREWESGSQSIEGVDIRYTRRELITLSLDPVTLQEHQEQWVTQNQQTYLAKSFSLQDIENNAGTEILLDDVDFSADYILNQEPLKETPGSIHTLYGGDLYKYNNRLMAANAKLKLYPGYQHFHSSCWRDVQDGQGFTMYFFIHGDNGDYVVTKNVTYRREALVSQSQALYTEYFGPLIAYPDSRCYKVMFVCDAPGSGNYGVKTLPMKALSEIDVAFAFLGFGNYVTPSVASINPSPAVKDTWIHNDSLFVAKVNNPFLFTTDNKHRFSNGNILAVGAVTFPLSEGQKGQFPLYIFTDEGVFALSVNSEGEFMTLDDVSRDIILSKNALTAIEQGIFFASARGLLLLQGNTVTKVSDLMDGPVDAMGQALAQTIGGLYFSTLPIPDADTFINFLQGCRMAYDYVAKRIIVFNPAKDYAYVYKIDTQSWHRLCFGKKMVKALNSYPEALIATLESGQTDQSVHDFSIPAESAGAVALPGLIYTRELLLDNADIYKTIKKLKIRGRYTDGNVKWQLQGSNDGVNYVNLHSLRGPSWKWYRIAIVTMLGPNERISYIEMDYEPRFSNKIR